MNSTTTYDLKCPRCAAHAPAGADWCSLCYADLRPAVTPEPEQQPEPVAAEPEPVQLEAEPALAELVTAGPPRGKHAKRAESGEPGDLGADGAATVDPDALLAQLAAAESGNPLGSYSRFVDTPAKKVGLMVGGAVAAMVLLFALMAIAGALL